jgi:hypothetical protein
MWLVDSRRLGHRVNRVVHAETRLRRIPALVTVRDKRKVKPEFSTLHRPKVSRPHAATRTGQSPGERLARGVRLRIATPDPHVIYATDRTDDIRGSPSCTGVGVVKLGRGVSIIGVSRPRPIGIRTSPPGSGVVPFSSRKPPDANIRAPAKSSGHFASFAWITCWIQVPYISGTVGANN